MKTKNRILRALIVLTQAQWMRSLMLTFVLFVPLFGVDGCGHKH